MMAGAFRYLEPTAPQPDPDVVFSGVPKPAPYSHVPTTGEVRNLDQPTDTFRDRIAQDIYDFSPLALGPAAYSVANMAKGAVQEMDPKLGAFAGAEAMFLGLPGMRNLQKAGKIAQGARGSEEAFKKALKGWKEGIDPGTVWDDTGWASGKEFGAFRDGRSPPPVAWHGMPDLDVVNYNPGTHKGTIGSLGIGVEDAGIAQPGLLDLPATFKISAELPRNQWEGTMNTGSSWGGAPRFSSMEIAAPDGDTASLIYAHELQHGLQGVDNIDWRGNDPNARFDAPNVVTETWRAFKKQQDQAYDKAWAELQKLPSGDPLKEKLLEQAGNSNSNANIAAQIAGESQKFARYANTPHEQQARITAAIYGRGRKAVEDGVYPGDISAFSDEAFYPFTAKGNNVLSPFGLSWEDYRVLTPKK